MAATDKTRIAKPSPIKENEQGQLVAKKGISRDVIEELSRVKGEPAWMRDKRLKSFEIFERKPIPTWGVDLSDLDLSELVLYSPPEAGRYDSWDDVPQEQKDTFEKLGIPQAEREHLAGVVGVWRQEPFYEGLKKEYADQGIVFCAMDTAVTEHEDLVREYFMNKCVPPQDNKFSALHGAVWLGGSFLYVEEGAKARYTTVQNWSKDVFNLNTKRAIVEAHGTVEWVGGSMGAKKVMLYPGSFLMGEGARADHLNVGVASGDVWKDTCADIQIQNPHVTVAHEAVVGKISDEQLFYLQSRGLTEEEAAAMIVNGFIEPVTKELPMEYAVELNRLIQLEMVDSIG